MAGYPQPMSQALEEQPIESPDTRLRLFQTLDTGLLHRLADSPWPRPLCMERYVIGKDIEAQVKDISCERCLAWYDPVTYEVRIPDARYKTGYRVVHEQVADEETARALAEKTGREDVVVAESPR